MSQSSNKKQRIESKNQGASEDDVPEAFLCPITLEVMEDPVLTVEGHAYERKAIEEWFSKGYMTNPCSNQPLGM